MTSFFSSGSEPQSPRHWIHWQAAAGPKALPLDLHPSQRVFCSSGIDTETVAMAAAAAGPIALPLDLHPSQPLSVLLLTGVPPGELEALRVRLASRALDVALLDAALLPSLLCLQAAASRALLARARGGARGCSASPHTDLVHALHGGKNWGESLRALGPRAGCSAVLLAALGEGAPDLRALHAAALPGAAAGDAAAFYAAQGAQRRVDEAALRALYRVGAEELALCAGGGLGALEAAVLGRVGEA